MQFRNFLVPAIFAASAPLFLSTIARADDQPDLNQIYIKSINAIGSGCSDASTYSINLSPDRRAFTLAFSEFVAEIGPGLPLSEARKNCSITLTLNIPAGFQYSIGSFNYRGFMDLGDKVRADHTTEYFFQGTGETGRFQATATGPLTKDFVYTDKVGLSSVYIPDTWSPCNVDRALTINPSIRLTKLSGAAADVQGLITNDTVDGELTQLFGLVYRKCGQTPPTPTPDPQPDPMPTPIDLTVGQEYNLVSVNSGLCLDVLDHGLGNGVPLQQWACTGEPHQKFRLVTNPDARYSLVAVQSGKTISVDSSLQDNGAAVIQWDAQNADNQKLIFEKSTDGSYLVRFRHSNKCLDVSDVSLVNGARVHQWECLNGANQKWYIRKAQEPLVPGAIYQIKPRNTGKCLDVFDHGLDNGVRLQQWSCTGEPHQKFRLIHRGGGVYALQGLQSGRFVSVEAASAANGANIIQWDDQNAPQQNLTLIPSGNGSYAVRFNHDSKCLDLDSGSAADGARVQQWDCQINNSNQDWIFNRQ